VNTSFLSPFFISRFYLFYLTSFVLNYFFNFVRLLFMRRMQWLGDPIWLETVQETGIWGSVSGVEGVFRPSGGCEDSREGAYKGRNKEIFDCTAHLAVTKK
jgi:hypothetical protein